MRLTCAPPPPPPPPWKKIFVLEMDEAEILYLYGIANWHDVVVAAVPESSSTIRDAVRINPVGAREFFQSIFRALSPLLEPW